MDNSRISIPQFYISHCKIKQEKGCVKNVGKMMKGKLEDRDMKGKDKERIWKLKAKDNAKM